jgi:hypothetical protein
MSERFERDGALIAALFSAYSGLMLLAIAAAVTWYWGLL